MLCHSNGRCQEWIEFALELLTFCKDVLEVVNFEDHDKDDMKIWWKKQLKNLEKTKDASNVDDQ